MSIASPNNSEWLTRKKLIDAELRKAGWRVVQLVAGTPLAKLDRCAIEEYPTATGPADYALCVAGQILGIVEAKKLHAWSTERIEPGRTVFPWAETRAPFTSATSACRFFIPRMAK